MGGHASSNYKPLFLRGLEGDVDYCVLTSNRVKRSIKVSEICASITMEVKKRLKKKQLKRWVFKSVLQAVIDV